MITPSQFEARTAGSLPRTGPHLPKNLDRAPHALESRRTSWLIRRPHLLRQPIEHFGEDDARVRCHGAIARCVKGVTSQYYSFTASKQQTARLVWPHPAKTPPTEMKSLLEPSRDDKRARHSTGIGTRLSDRGGGISAAAAETTFSSADLLGLRRSLRLHAAGGLVVLLVLVALSIYKPRGMTRSGWSRQYEQRL